MHASAQYCDAGHNGRSFEMSLIKIVSGGQTGVDRGALDAALAAGFPCGGWCPGDRAAEDGPIPERYPMSSLPVLCHTDVGTARPVGGQYRQRTLKNVQDSEGTAILFSQSSRVGRSSRAIYAFGKRSRLSCWTRRRFRNPPPLRRLCVLSKRMRFRC